MTGLLTRRQREVLLLAANGNSNADIGRWLWITPDTVNGILRNAYRALGAGDRAQAVALALRAHEFGLDDIREPEADYRLRPSRPREGPSVPA
ncbi:helix-turn-helix transcriptional regulator [Streptomyces scopuliridis]|uniref:helix-turn-helix domain-containing protein n=1 Tax=Streptomyces scopuliridis TaxID=452529 RepID=UPI00368EE43D